MQAAAAAGVRVGELEAELRDLQAKVGGEGRAGGWHVAGGGAVGGSAGPAGEGGRGGRGRTDRFLAFCVESSPHARHHACTHSHNTHATPSHHRPEPPPPHTRGSASAVRERGCVMFELGSENRE